jgi:hypothetical protein
MVGAGSDETDGAGLVGAGAGASPQPMAEIPRPAMAASASNLRMACFSSKCKPDNKIRKAGQSRDLVGLLKT